MIKIQSRSTLRKKRLPRIRKKLIGQVDRLRLIILKSNYSLTAQLVDDKKNQTVFLIRNKGKNLLAAQKLATDTLKFMKSKKITIVKFDRSGYKYHGAVKLFAETIREGGVTI